jgi:hypothetical protein
MRPQSCSRDLGHGISPIGFLDLMVRARCVLAQRDMVRCAKAAENAEAGPHDPATGGAGGVAAGDGKLGFHLKAPAPHLTAARKNILGSTCNKASPRTKKQFG